MTKLWKRLAIILVRTFCRTGIITLALDDTLFHHSGKKLDGAGWWRDAVRSTKKSIVYAWGLTFIVQPWNPLKATPSFADALCCLRRELWTERIKCMFGKFAVHDKKFRYLLEALAPAA